MAPAALQASSILSEKRPGCAKVSPSRSVVNWNKEVYESADVVDTYTKYIFQIGPFPPEQVILQRWDSAFRNQALLDLGVGGGRTIPFLQPLAGVYVGLDYSEAMLACCRKRFPGVDLRQGDARHLRDFPDASFNAAWFPFNGIDYVPGMDREQIIQEVHRVLRPHGLFVFSTHNLAVAVPRPGLWPRFTWHPNPARLLIRNARALWEHLRSRRYYFRNRNQERYGDGYALLVDDSHQYRLLTFRVTIPFQKQQLTQVGFSTLDVLDGQGHSITTDFSPDPWFYFVAQKKG